MQIKMRKMLIKF
ncbi:hypothetical protein Ahy_A10g048696 isoform E [Arachis hypogaea]|uniref:Uncharacterized protein n=1 Tax=Arachis hypogaea TaxID=3818 RepID=A0A445B5R9_ARAHY|nr:hypothetical protein Ahy_A10g048696 isoform E [Arachis hypogaea]